MPVDVTVFSPAVDRPGGCFSCRYFGHLVDVAVWCGKRSRSLAGRSRLRALGTDGNTL
jgi:hypothetical protein